MKAVSWPAELSEHLTNYQLRLGVLAGVRLHDVANRNLFGDGFLLWLSFSFCRLFLGSFAGFGGDVFYFVVVLFGHFLVCGEGVCHRV